MKNYGKCAPSDQFPLKQSLVLDSSAINRIHSMLSAVTGHQDLKNQSYEIGQNRNQSRFIINIHIQPFEFCRNGLQRFPQEFRSNIIVFGLEKSHQRTTESVVVFLKNLLKHSVKYEEISKNYIVLTCEQFSEQRHENMLFLGRQCRCFLQNCSKIWAWLKIPR